jgi:hypothetical protein
MGLFFVEELKKNPKIFWLKAAIEFVVVIIVAILFAFGLAFFLVDRNEHEKVVTYKAIDPVHVEIEVSIIEFNPNNNFLKATVEVVKFPKSFFNSTTFKVLKNFTIATEDTQREYKVNSF